MTDYEAETERARAAARELADLAVDYGRSLEVDPEQAHAFATAMLCAALARVYLAGLKMEAQRRGDAAVTRLQIAISARNVKEVFIGCMEWEWERER